MTLSRKSLLTSLYKREESKRRRAESDLGVI